jgi:hypothetical protein
MKENTIVTLVMSNNAAEIIGKFIAEDFNSITLYKPRLVQATAQGVGLLNGITMTGIEPKGDFQFPKSSVMFMIETVEELAAGWTQQTSGIAVPTKSGLIK